MYAELRCKTNFTFLTGASHGRELVTQAAQLGLEGLAITDRHGVYALPKAFYEARRHPNLRLITGSDLDIKSGPTLTLLAQTRQGYGRLCRLLTAAHAGGPDAPAGLEWFKFLELIDHQSRNDLLILIHSNQILDREEELTSYYAPLKDLFGDRLGLTLTRYLDGRDKKRTHKTQNISKAYDIPILASNDVYYHIRERKCLQDVLTSTRHLTPLEQSGVQLLQNGERYLKSYQEMKKLFSDIPEALELTRDWAKRCTFQLSELKYQYPSEWIPQDHTAQSYLRHLTLQGAQTRYSSSIPDDVMTQLEHELDMVQKLQFADYFLTIWEIVDFARGRGILCQGRGSAANSAICYCLGITAVDPVRMNLLFERFLSAERGEPPDIDVDFEHERREEVIQHIYEKYGRDRAGMVSAIITYRTRSALRDVSRAFGIDMEIGTYRSLRDSTRSLTPVSMSHPRNSGAQVVAALKAPPTQLTRIAPDLDFDKVKEMVEELKGFPRHLSIHTGGFTISRDPLIETVPIQPARMEARTIIQWDKEDLEIVGLIKVDILALGMLTAIQKTLKMINLELHQIPAEDLKTYQMIGRCETIGVFQIESRAQMSMLGRLQPRNFYDLVIEVAIVRPGPILGKMVHPYLRRRRGEEPVLFPHPKLKAILGKTLGIPIFQEQVMKMAIELAGFTPGEADELRRAINAWRSAGSIEKVGQKLMEGLLKSGLKQDFVQQIFEQIKGFAHYGFPESHAASFALLTYASSYLKCHYPMEFVCSLINSQPMGFYAAHTLLEEAKRSGVRILPVDVQKSEEGGTCSDQGLRLGLKMTAGISLQEAQSIVQSRKERAFLNLRDFLSRTRLRGHILHRLAIGGAFECFGLNPREALWELLSEQLLISSRTQEQMTLFESLSRSTSEPSLSSSMTFATLRNHELIQNEFEVYQASARGHPVMALRERGFVFPRLTTQSVRKRPSGSLVQVGGLVIVRQKPPTAKGTVFATLEDEYGFLDCVLHRNVYARVHDIFDAHSFVIMKGRIQKDGNTLSLIIQSIQPLYQENQPPA